MNSDELIAALTELGWWPQVRCWRPTEPWRRKGQRSPCDATAVNTDDTDWAPVFGAATARDALLGLLCWARRGERTPGRPTIRLDDPTDPAAERPGDGED